MTEEESSELEKVSVEETKLILEEWKTVIQTQMHFNELLMKMRTTAVSIVLAVFGAAAYSLQYTKLLLTINDYSFHVAAFIVIFGLGMLAGVFGLDYFYYYKMLLGAVERGDQIDEAYKNRRVDNCRMFGMTTLIHKAIGKRGRSKWFVWFFYGLIFALGVIFIVGILRWYPPTFNNNG